MLNNLAPFTGMGDIGLELKLVKAKLEHGKFENWIIEELPFSPSTARRFGLFSGEQVRQENVRFVNDDVETTITLIHYKKNDAMGFNRTS